jgi:hypothetical protein
VALLKQSLLATRMQCLKATRSPAGIQMKALSQLERDLVARVQEAAKRLSVEVVTTDVHRKGAPTPALVPGRYHQQRGQLCSFATDKPTKAMPRNQQRCLIFGETATCF